MRLVFITAGALSECLLLLILLILRQNKTSLVKAISRMFIAAFLAILGNILIAFAINDTITYAAYCIYFYSMDFITYYMLMYAMIYTGRERYLNQFSRLWYVVMGLDGVSLLSNIAFPHAFVVYTKTLSDGSVAYLMSGKAPFNIHLAICYIAFFLSVLLLSISLFRSKGFYRFKYFPLLASLVVIILVNAAYLSLKLPFDWSVLLYATAALLLCYFSISFIPKKLTEQTLHLAADAMREGMILFDAEQNCLYVNKTARDLFGVRQETLQFGDYPLSVWLKDENKTEPDEFIRTFSMEIGGQPLMIRVNHQYCLDERKNHLGNFFFFENVTEDMNLLQSLKEARAEANQANLAKSLFLANMSHEIRTPINSILGMDEMILREATEPNILEYADNMKESGEVLLSLVNTILDISKIESGKMELHPIDYNVFRMIRECYNLVIPRAQQKDLPIVVECESGIPTTLRGDAEKIKQILVNLLTNSIKYTAQGQVTLRVCWEAAEEGNGLLTMTVSDTGQGISDEDIAKLFQIFQRLRENENRTVEGTGLGLALSRKLAHLMGGEISVSSVPNKGSDFTIHLPQPVVDATPSGDYETTKVSTPQKSAYREAFHAPTAHILVVDDVEMNLKLLRNLLKKTELQITTALDGRTAYNLCQDTEFDLILMDHMMPSPDGTETMNMIRESGGHNAKVPIIVLTANAVEGAEETYLSMGFDSYLSKPVRSAELEAMLLRFLPKDKLEIIPTDL